MKNWQKRIESAKKFIRRGNEFLYDAIQELVAVFDDPEFSTDVIAEGSGPREYLDVIVSGTCANFTELYQMLKKFPNKEQWAEGSLDEMRLQMIRDLRPIRRNGNGDKPHQSLESRETEEHESKDEKRRKNEEEQMSWKERCLKAEEQLRIVRTELKAVRAENRDMKDIIKNLGRKRQLAKV